LPEKAARKHKTVNKEKYVTGSAERIPFSNNTFDAVTAFAAFHWFDNKASLNEIKRVLKPGGIFFVVNKTGLKS
jgi:ubiquinone/menaquinone biosynthesis C-methylase UbiE